MANANEVSSLADLFSNALKDAEFEKGEQDPQSNARIGGSVLVALLAAIKKRLPEAKDTEAPYLILNDILSGAAPSLAGFALRLLGTDAEALFNARWKNEGRTPSDAIARADALAEAAINEVINRSPALSVMTAAGHVASGLARNDPAYAELRAALDAAGCPDMPTAGALKQRRARHRQRQRQSPAEALAPRSGKKPERE